MSALGIATGVTQALAGGIQGFQTGVNLRHMLTQEQEYQRAVQQERDDKEMYSNSWKEAGMGFWMNQEGNKDLPPGTIRATATPVTVSGQPGQGGQPAQGGQAQGQPAQGGQPAVNTGALAPRPLGSLPAGTPTPTGPAVALGTGQPTPPQPPTNAADPSGRPNPIAGPPGVGMVQPQTAADQAALSGQMSLPSTRNITGFMNKMTDYYNRTGRPEKSVDFMNTMFKVQQTGMSQELRNALMVIDTDPAAAGRYLQRAYSYLPNGQSLRFGVQNGQLFLQSTDEDTGQVRSQGVVDSKWIQKHYMTTLDPQKFFELQMQQGNYDSLILTRDQQLDINRGKAVVDADHKAFMEKNAADRTALMAQYKKVNEDLARARDFRDVERLGMAKKQLEMQIDTNTQDRVQRTANYEHAQSAETRARDTDIANVSTGNETSLQQATASDVRRLYPNVGSPYIMTAIQGLTSGQNQLVPQQDGSVVLPTQAGNLRITDRDLAVRLAANQKGAAERGASGYGGGGLPRRNETALATGGGTMAPVGGGGGYSALTPGEGGTGNPMPDMPGEFYTEEREE